MSFAAVVIGALRVNQSVYGIFVHLQQPEGSRQDTFGWLTIVLGLMVLVNRLYWVVS